MFILLQIYLIILFITCKYNKNRINMKYIKLKYETEYFISNKRFQLFQELKDLDIESHLNNKKFLN